MGVTRTIPLNVGGNRIRYNPEEFYADPELVLKIIHPEDKPGLESALQNSYVENVTHRLIRKDGRVVWCEGVHLPVYDEAGNWIATEGISRDIIEQEREPKPACSRSPHLPPSCNSKWKRSDGSGLA